MSYLARLREAENFGKRPSPPSVESVETPLNPTFDTLDTAPPGPFSIFASTETRRAWWVRTAAGHLLSVTYCPPATEAYVRRRYPGALEVEPILENEHV